MWQHFFVKEKKILNKYIFMLNDYPDYIWYKKDEMNIQKDNWNEYFKNSNPICLEIGSGAGNFTVRMAEKFPDKNYIGLEIRFKRLVFSARKAEKRNLKNILFLRRKAEELAECFGENEISEVHINFPDPWDERLKNRIISKKLLENLDIVLKKEGKIFVKTDHVGYYEDTLKLIEGSCEYKVIYHTDDFHNSDKSLENVKTEFEELFTLKEITTKYIEIQKEV